MYMLKANTVKKSSKEAVFKDEILYKMFIKMAPLIIEDGYQSRKKKPDDSTTNPKKPDNSD